jgi:hypothetical protein
VVEEVVMDFEEDTEEAVVLLLTMGMARAEPASAAAMKANEACILSRYDYCSKRKGTCQQKLILEATVVRKQEKEMESECQSERGSCLRCCLLLLLLMMEKKQQVGCLATYTKVSSSD